MSSSSALRWLTHRLATPPNRAKATLASGGPGLSGASLVGAWVPGMRAAPLPSGIAVEAKQDEALVMQVHYHGNGLSDADQTQLDLSKSPDTNPQLIRFLPIANLRFELPPSQVTTVHAAQPALLSQFLAGRIYFVAPHMHLLGVQATMSLELPDGTRQPLIDIPDWDFNWQGAYLFTKPIDYPRGCRLHLTCKFNNTESNLDNPNNPLTTVRWGEGTQDEMCLGFVGIVSDRQPGPFFNFLAGAVWRFAPSILPATRNAGTFGLPIVAAFVILVVRRRANNLAASFHKAPAKTRCFWHYYV